MSGYLGIQQPVAADDNSVETVDIVDGAVTDAKLANPKLDIAGGTMTGNLNLGDNNKIQLGAGSDLQIYHDGSHSRIYDQGTGNLIMQGSSAVVFNGASTEHGRMTDGGACQFGYGGSTKIATTSTGVDVTGSVICDGMTSAGNANITSGNLTVIAGTVTLGNTDATAQLYAGGSNTHLSLNAVGTAGAVRAYTNGSERMRITSTGNVGIGTTSPSTSLHITGGSATVEGSVLANNLVVRDGTDNYIQLGLNGRNTHFTGQSAAYIWAGQGASGDYLAGTLNFQSRSSIDRDINFITGGTPAKRLTIAGNGNVGINTTTPNTNLQVNSTSSITTLFHRPNNTSFAPHGIAFSTRSDGADGGFGDARSGVFSDYNGDIFLSASAGTNISGDPLAYSRLFIEGDNGNVGIGTTTPSGKLHIKQSGNGAVNSLIVQDDARTLYIGRDQINCSGTLYLATDNKNIGMCANGGNVGIGTTSPTTSLTIKKLHTSGYGNGTGMIDLKAAYPNYDEETTKAQIYAGTSNEYTLNTHGGFLAFKTNQSGYGGTAGATNLLEGLRIEKSGKLRHLHNGSNYLEVFYAHGHIGGNQSMNVDIPIHSDSSTGTYFHVEAAMTHHPSYDIALETWVSRRSTNQRSDEQYRRNTSNSGSWSVSSPDTTTLRVTKNAGSYTGGGPWWIRVTYRTA